MKHLFTSVAFINSGVRTMMNYKRTPSPADLVAAVEYLDSMPTTVEDDKVNKRAPDMAAMHPYWQQVQTMLDGWEAVKNSTDDFLPKFPDEDNEDYQFRCSVTKFTNIFSDILDGLAVKPFEKEVSFKNSDGKSDVPEAIVEFAEDVDGNGSNLSNFLSTTFYNGIAFALDWILVDMPVADPNKVITRADAKAFGIRPFWSHVLADNVLEVRYSRVGSRNELSYARILEPGNGLPDHIRIFEMLDGGKTVWSLYQKQDATNGKKQWVLVDKGELSITGIPLIPFTTARRSGTSWNVKPPMKDAFDLQVQLYRNESALEFLKVTAAYPMLSAAGMRPEKEADGKTPKKLKRGPLIVLWSAPDSKGNYGEWKFVEPSAENMKFLSTDVQQTKEDLREIGKQPLTANNTNITVISSAVAAGKANSAVGAWALALKDAAENALMVTSAFMNVADYQPELEIYTEFDTAMNAAEDMKIVVEMRRNGDISRKAMIDEAIRRGVLAPDFDIDKDAEHLLEDIPTDPNADKDDQADDRTPTG